MPFKVLVDALKAAARVRWKAVWVHEQGGPEPVEKVESRNGSQGRSTGLSSGIVFQQLAFEDQESFRALVCDVSEAVESTPTTVQHRKYLPRLWEFLRTSSADPGTAAVPSRRRVAELLGIPRYLLPELYGQLSQIVEHCRSNEHNRANHYSRGNDPRRSNDHSRISEHCRQPQPLRRQQGGRRL